MDDLKLDKGVDTASTPSYTKNNGGDASRSKHINIQSLFYIIRNPNSSAVENISIEDQTVTVTFSGGRSYDYTVNDVTAFTTALTAAMAPEVCWSLCEQVYQERPCKRSLPDLD